MDAHKYLTLTATIFGLMATAWTFLAWLRTQERKRLEGERQLSHALNNFGNLSNAIGQLQEDLKEMTIELAQIKTLLSLGLNVPALDKPRVRR